uniref:Uncharacterized protein n=1 Tax=Cacopsylla melanoneura TaxID=428564 RepID=A0A8D8UGK1_9HEMI
MIRIRERVPFIAWQDKRFVRVHTDPVVRLPGISIVFEVISYTVKSKHHQCTFANCITSEFSSFLTYSGVQQGLDLVHGCTIKSTNRIVKLLIDLRNFDRFVW